MKVTRDDSRGFESDSKLRTGSSNYHSAVHLRHNKGEILNFSLPLN